MRNGPLDKPTLEAFIDEEEQESQNADPYAPNTEAVMKLADHHIDSSRSLTKVMDDLDIIAGQFISR